MLRSTFYTWKMRILVVTDSGFVALSRVKNYKDFLIEPLSLDRLAKISKSLSLKPRLEEEKRVDIIIKNTLDLYKHLFRN